MVPVPETQPAEAPAENLREVQESELESSQSEEGTVTDETEKKEETSQDFKNIELADEAQIMDELEGAVFDRDAYIYARQGKYRLTYAGVLFACRELAKHGEAIRIVGDAIIGYDPSNPEYLTVQVKAQRIKVDSGREMLLDSSIGSKRKWVKERLKDGSVQEDPYFWEKAVSMAQRNAKYPLLPQKFVGELIERIRTGKSVGDTTAGASSKRGRSSGAKAQQSGTSGPSGTQKGAQTSGTQSGPSNDAWIKKARQQIFLLAKKAAGTDSKDDLRKYFSRVFGFDRLTAIPADKLKPVGTAVRKLSEGEARLVEDNGPLYVLNQTDGGILWPVGYQPPEKGSQGSSGAETSQGEDFF